MAETNSLANLQSLIQTFTGKEATQKTSGTTSTTSSSLTEADIAKLIQTALESNSGLASIANGQVGAGMYNSTVNKQLTNDLLARISGQYAAQSATKTTTTSGGTVKTTTPGVGSGGLLGLIAASALKGQLDPYLSGKKKLTDLLPKSDNSSVVDDTTAATVDISKITATPEISNTATDYSMFDTSYSDLATGALSAIQDVDFSEVASNTDFIDSIGSGIGVDAASDFVDSVGAGAVELDWDSLEWDW